MVGGVGVEKKEEPQSAHKQDDSASEDSRRRSKDRTGQASDTYTAVTPPGAAQTSSGTIALRTIPVYIKNGMKGIKS